MPLLRTSLAALAACAAILWPSVANANGVFHHATSTTPLGSFGGIAYTQYKGIFEGKTSTSEYRVPYLVVTASNPAASNHIVIVEPPHFAVGPATVSDNMLGRELVFSRGFSHASVGYGTFWNLILDSSVPDVYVHDGFVFEIDGVTYHIDDEIIVDFARALKTDALAVGMLGHLEREYFTGFSQSSSTVLRILDSGWAEGLFDLAFPFIAEAYPGDSPDPQDTLARRAYNGRLVIVGSEGGENGYTLTDRGNAPDQYRYYAVSGSAHVSDPFQPQRSNASTPATYHPALRAHFLQADRWTRTGKDAPPPSTHVQVRGYEFVRDANGNAFTYETLARERAEVPRLPMVELGEARFRATWEPPDYDCCGFFGTFDGGAPGKAIPSLTQLRDASGREYRFSSFKDYFKAFRQKLKALVKARYLRRDDEAAFCCRAKLGAKESLTYTQMYQDHYAVLYGSCHQPPADSCNEGED